MENDRTQETTAIVTGMGLAALGLFCGLALYSHSSADVMDYDAAQAGQIVNLGGLIGAQIAHHLLCLYGFGAWMTAFALVGFGVLITFARSLHGMTLRGIGSVLLLAAICTWAGTLRPTDQEAARAIYPAGLGGLVGGKYLAPPLVRFFGEVGIYLVLVAAIVLSGLLIAQELTESALMLLGRGVAHLVRLGWSAAVGRLQPAPDLAAAGAAGESVRLHPQTARGAPKLDRLALDNAGSRAAVGELLAEPPVKETRVDKPLRRSLALALKEQAPEEKALEEKSRKEEPKAESEAKPVSSDESSRLRHEEAVRQAEAAEKERQAREKELKEQAAREAKALEKLDKERKVKEQEREKARAKFEAAMAAQEPKAEATGERAEGEPAKPPKPRLPDDYKLPDIQVLDAKDEAKEIPSEVLKERGIKLIETLWEFKIGSRLVSIVHGPAVTMYELSLDPGIKVQRVISLQDNLAMAMKSEYGVRIIAPLPGRDTIGIEIPNTEDYVVRMRPILESPQFRTNHWTLPLVLGRDATGNPLVADLSKMPHLLIAGTTGSGKSVCVNSIILSLLLMRRPQEVKLILVDPKQVEMTDFKGIPHLLSPVVTDMKLAAGVLTWAVQKMEERYDRMSKVGVRNISTFNKLSQEERLARLPQNEPPEEYVDPMPYIVIIVDEFADLMMSSGKEIEQAIARLAQKARAAGIHVILATQRPSADVVTGLIKTNLPCRICFQVKSKIDSRIVLDTGGADKLAGKGDMLFVPPGSSQLIRAKGVYIGDHEVRAIVDGCKKQAEPIYSDEIEKVAQQAAQSEEQAQEAGEKLALDDKFDEAVECFLAVGRASTSMLQRRMGLGYTRAAKICDQMEHLGIVGPDRGAKGRELLITLDGWEAYKKTRVGAAAFGAQVRQQAGANADAAPEGDAPNRLIECLDRVDGTRADENGEDPEQTGDGNAAPDPELVAKLDPRDSASAAG